MPNDFEIKKAREILRKEHDALILKQLHDRHQADTSHPAHALRAAGSRIHKNLSGTSLEGGVYEPVSKAMLSFLEDTYRDIHTLEKWVAASAPDVSEAEIDAALDAIEKGLTPALITRPTGRPSWAEISGSEDDVLTAANRLAKSEGISVGAAITRVVKELGDV